MNKRHNEHMKMRDVLKEFVQENNLQQGLDKVDVKEAWFSVMGKGVQSYTNEVILQGTTLHIQLSSSVLREELSYGKDKIISLLNEALDRDLIQKLILR